MDPTKQFCHNPDSVLRSHIARRNINVQSQWRRRYNCARCRKTFSATKETACYCLHPVAAIVTLVLTFSSTTCKSGSRQALTAAPALRSNE